MTHEQLFRGESSDALSNVVFEVASVAKVDPQPQIVDAASHGLRRQQILILDQERLNVGRCHGWHLKMKF